MRLEVLDSGRVIGRTLAAAYRADLAACGLAQGWCSFNFRFAPAAPPRDLRAIAVRRASDRAMLTTEDFAGSAPAYRPVPSGHAARGAAEGRGRAGLKGRG